MATQATIGNWKLLVDPADEQTPSYVSVEEVREVSRIGTTSSSVEVTNFDSDLGTKEFIAGLSEGDEVSVTMNFIPDATVQVQLESLVGTTLPWKLTYKTTVKEYTFRGALTSFGATPSTTDANTTQMTLKVSGAITIGP